MKTGIIKDPRYMEHDMGSFHVESPRRLDVIYRMLDQEFTFPLEHIEPRAAAKEELEMIHDEAYVKRIKETSGKGRVVLDPDTSTSARSYEVACLAAGGVMNLSDAVIDQKVHNGFALVRPPGHHAEAGQSMGFCLFNNIAIAAEHLIRKHGLERILIVDWDLHHGNGTQNSFYTRRDVMYFSTHQYPHYPGTGHWSETGRGEGEGFTVNVPLSAGKTDADYLYAFDTVLTPIARAFKPEFILVSAGFDIYNSDPLGGMQVTGEGFGALTRLLMSLAGETAEKRILFALEGGYDLQGLKEGVYNVLLQLTENAEPPVIAEKASPVTERELGSVLSAQKKYWPLDHS